MNCFLHTDREAVAVINAQAWPEVLLGLCIECQHDPGIVQKVWIKQSLTRARRNDVYKSPLKPGKK
jgi:hypothetical protein